MNPDSLVGDKIEKVRQEPDHKDLECHAKESAFCLEATGNLCRNISAGDLPDMVCLSERVF